MAASREPCWCELRPYLSGEGAERGRGRAEAAGALRPIMDHVARFLLVLQKGGDTKVRTYIRVRRADLAALEVLDGIETVNCDGPVLDPGGARPKRYRMRRHTALPVADDDTRPSSMYAVMDGSAEPGATVLLHARKAAVVPVISAYVRDTELGAPTGGAGKLLSALLQPGQGSRRPVSAVRAARLAAARKKLASGRLFICNLAAWAPSVAGRKAVESAFPAAAFAPSELPPKRLRKLLSGIPSVPFWRGHLQPVLTDVEIGSFLSLPTPDDIRQTNIVTGRRRTYSSGPHADVGEDYTLLS